ncbi:hypothetical protein CQA53_04755 [Helicobacter didelphidarum]|uniref:DnaA initiator-associating factor for replication initiation HobA n=1 Tax=Helicobacter didelphidarum TaxID=2040648 RepID=A0A3D8ILV9_9HELI|nr:HobA family DNA replication regulator [Helicobacter didelphidarum]RDU66113.1 hypothetical protein CQA53_04755 [Helicobacter didelphidarum]
MQSINEWMLKTLRNDAEHLNAMPSHWLEIIRDTWTPLIMRAISFILNDGTFLLCTDSKRSWLQTYILSKLNSLEVRRPYIPIYSFDVSLLKLLCSKKDSDNGALQDVLNMSYHRYALWYIGKIDNDIAKFALEIPESFLWVLDESLENSFMLQSSDLNLDFKLIQAYRIFEQALFAGICGEFHIEER